MADIYQRDDLVDIYNSTDEKSKIKELNYKLNGLEKSTVALLKTIKDTYNTPAYEDAKAELQEVSLNKANISQELEKLKALSKTISEKDRKQVSVDLMKVLKTEEILEAKKYLKSVISEILVSNEDVEVVLNIA